MSDVPPPKDFFEKMNAGARAKWGVPKVASDDDEDDEPVYTAVLYEAHLEHADESEPLWRVPYFGQVVRVGTAKTIFEARKREHETDAAREDKDLGFHAVIDRFGPDAMAWRIVSSASGPRIAMQEMANAEEIRLIDENGGMLRDMDAKLEQTLNLTKGGQGDARAVWAGIDARRKRAFTKFQAAMAKYVEEYDSALVPQTHVDKVGYPLGAALNNFKQGHFWKSTPWEDDAVAWAQALPKWAWNARETDDFREAASRRADDWWGNASERQKSERISKQRKTMATDASKDKRSKIATVQLANERLNELEYARSIVVPFEKSKKRRVAMRAASEHTKPLGCGRTVDRVLYMQSEDGKDIRRVAKNGDMCKHHTVGPVVDPPHDAFDSESD
jgi:hypothetical protein